MEFNIFIMKQVCFRPINITMLHIYFQIKLKATFKLKTNEEETQTENISNLTSNCKFRRGKSLESILIAKLKAKYTSH